MPKVVVNSTPLIVLSGIGKLELLQSLYSEVTIPEAVYKEVTAKEDSAFARVTEARAWIHVEKIPDVSEKKMYRAKLHDGEVEVMILAQKAEGDVLTIIDDNAAKKTAKYLGLKVTGTMGVLLKAKQLGYIVEIRPLLDEMKKNGFYISDAVKKLVLESAGE